MNTCEVLRFPKARKRGAKVRRGPCAQIIPFPYKPKPSSPYEGIEEFARLVGKIKGIKPEWSDEHCRCFAVTLCNATGRLT